MTNDHVANTAAILEKYFSELSEYDDKHLPDGFEIVDLGTFKGEVNAVTVKDASGNIYVHYNGTGDGNWQYNAAAYGEASQLQKWSTDYFDSIYEEYYDGRNSGNLYVTGHSQGGNNAQYVTISSEYADQITNCISLDGPGFSTQVVEQCKALYGEEYYERQRGKIYAYNGENDFVSCLGQVQIIPEEHVTFIQTPRINIDDNVFFIYHQVLFLMDDGDQLNGTGVEGDFRLFIIQLNEEIKKLPQDQQARVAELMMKVVENKGAFSAPMTEQELAEIKELLIPVLIDTLANNPDMVAPMLETLGLDPAIITLAEQIIKNFNNLPVEDRKEALETLAKILVIKDGNLEVDIRVFISEFIEDHPDVTAAAIVALIFFSPFIITFIAMYNMINKIIEIVQGMADIAENVKDFILSCILAIQETLGKLSEYLRSISPGGRYANANPYFKVDTGKLRSYAARINNVNNRLRMLDSELRALYWQVGLLDIWDVLLANLITSGSPTLNQVKSYLSNAADCFDTAENKACGYMGG